jgi:transposase
MGQNLLRRKLPMYDVTKLVKKSTFQKLLEILPTPKQKKTGRKRVDKSALLNGILQVLVNGVSWHKIAECGCSYVSCWRYFKELQRRGDLKLIYQQLAKEETDITECSSDTDTIRSFRFKRGVGWDGKHKVNGTKISLIGDKEGFPADIEINSAKIHDKDYLYKHLENVAGRRKRILNLDLIYTSAELRQEMRKKGTYVNMKMKKGDYIRKRGPKFRFKEEKYKVRFKIERTFGWLESFKRLLVRVDRSLSSFRGFVYLALIIILIRI